MNQTQMASIFSFKKMKTLSDRDLGIDCDFVAEGETTDEVIDATTEHIRSEHPDEYDRVKGMMKMHIQVE